MKSVLAPFMEMVKSNLFPFYQVELHDNAFFFVLYIHVFV